MNKHKRSVWMTWAMVAACLSVMSIGCGGDDPVKPDASVEGNEDSGLVDDPVQDAGSDGGVDGGGSDSKDGGQDDGGTGGGSGKVKVVDVSPPGSKRCVDFCQEQGGTCVDEVLLEELLEAGEVSSGGTYATYGTCKFTFNCDVKLEATMECNSDESAALVKHSCKCRL